MNKATMTEVKVIELNPEQIKRIIGVIRMINGQEGPPTPGCTCKVCEIKMLLALVVNKDPDFMDVIMKDITEKDPGWRAAGREAWQKSVVEYFENTVKKHVLEILTKEFESETGNKPAKDLTLNIGGEMPVGLLDNEDLKSIINMKPAKA